MPLKILHIIDKTHYAGVTSYVLNLIKSLEQVEHVILSCYKGSAAAEIEGMNIKCEHLIVHSRTSYKLLLKKYLRSIIFFRKNKFDIVHYQQGGIGILLIAVFFNRNIKVIHHLQSSNLIGDHSKSEISFIHKQLLKFLSYKTIKIAVADHVEEIYKKVLPTNDMLFTIKTSVPYNFNHKEKYSNTIGFIGRINKKKGIDNFLHLADSFYNIDRNIHFIVQGGIEDQIKLNSNILYNKPTFNIANFFNEIDLLYFLSTSQEGLPLVVLEAISFDVGVIAFRLPGVVEILGEDYPLYINHPDEATLKIKDFYSHKIDRNYLSKIHQERSSKFLFDDMIGKIDSLYKSLFNEKSITNF